MIRIKQTTSTNKWTTIYLDQKGSFIKIADGVDPEHALNNAIRHCNQCLEQLGIMLHDSIRNEKKEIAFDDENVVHREVQTSS